MLAHPLGLTIAREHFPDKRLYTGTSRVVQWIRICCPCRGNRFEPLSRKIPHATGQLSLCSTTTEPMHSRAHALQQKKHHNEKPMRCN